jgi:hypothetical protein
MTPTIRRHVLYASLIAAAFSTAVTTAAAVSTIASGATITMPTAAQGTCPVSPRMAKLVEMYRAVSANIDSIDPHGDPAAWTAAEQAWEIAEANLMNEQPTTVCDFAVKFDTLVEIDSSESEFPRLKRLSEDANALAGAAK